MSITSAFSNALSGLNAVSRAAEVVSSNVANAMTEDYARREIQLSAQIIGSSGAGVSVDGITRITDAAVTGERRILGGEIGLGEVRSNFSQTFTSAMGQADEEDSITGQMIDLETSLIEAASQPESEARLNAVLDSAQSLAEKINSAADTLMNARMDADADIATTVETLNAALQQVVDLNVAIQKSISTGVDANSLMDQRQSVIDQISEIVPVKEISKDNNMVGLYTTGGAILVDSSAATFEFTAVPTITPDMTIESGILSGLSLNGKSISTGTETGPISGGSLSGLFEVRDELIPEAQGQIDAIARDLIERFETTDTDSTLSSGDPGLFTDSGSALDASLEVGLSNRLEVNVLVNPDEGGDIWKLRDGIGAVSEGDQGDATILQSMTSALQTSKVVSSGGFTSSSRSAAELSSDLYSIADTQFLNLQTDLSFSYAQNESLEASELAAGVDTDYELQQLLIIEQTYAANAKVIETVDSLLDDLIRML
jgi:flagellar hook-associated protein 1 FlgK